MIRLNQFSSNNRQDDLLKRLKQCVGSIENTPRDNRAASSHRLSEKLKDKQSILDQSNNQRRYEERTSYRQSISNKQNQTDQKYYLKGKDYRQSSNIKSSIKDQNQDILMLTKNYLNRPQNNNKSYRSDRKSPIPLNDALNITNVKRDLFVKQNQEGKNNFGVKEVTQSTRKRIAQRESLINDQTMKITPRKLKEKQKNNDFNEDQFLQRLSLRKNNYMDQNYSSKKEPARTQRDDPKENKTQSARYTANNRDSFDEYKIDSRANEPQRIKVERYENYSKATMGNLVKDNDLRKAEKMQKLKKITKMNEEINNRIKKIVDTFENYLTHRQI